MLMFIPCSIFHLHSWHSQAGRLLFRSRYFVGYTALVSCIVALFLVIYLFMTAYSFANDALLWPLYILYPFVVVWLIYVCIELNKCWCCCCKYIPTTPRPQFSWMSSHWASVYLHEHLATLRPPSDELSNTSSNERLKSVVCPACWQAFDVPLVVPRQPNCDPACTDAAHSMDCINHRTNVSSVGVVGCVHMRIAGKLYRCYTFRYPG